MLLWWTTFQFLWFSHFLIFIPPIHHIFCLTSSTKEFSQKTAIRLPCTSMQMSSTGSTLMPDDELQYLENLYGNVSYFTGILKCSELLHNMGPLVFLPISKESTLLDFPEQINSIVFNQYQTHDCKSRGKNTNHHTTTNDIGTEMRKRRRVMWFGWIWKNNKR